MPSERGFPRPTPEERRQIAARMQALVAELRKKSGGHGAGVSEADIGALEAQFGLPFPPDYCEYLKAAGGANARPWRGLWRVDEVGSLNVHLPVFQWFGGLIGFGNEGFSIYALDYRRGLPPSVVTFGMSSSDWEDVTQEAASFEEWLRDALRA